MLDYFFRNHNRCKHKKVTPFSAGRFCPDCGKEIKISWLVLRCACCQSKREACVVFNSPLPRDKYCMKCGHSGYNIEKKETPDFFDFQYAVISKTEVNNDAEIRETLQIWIEKECNASNIVNNLRLIPLFN